MGERGRVLQLLGPSTGGIRRHVVFLTEALRQRGWDVDVAGPAGVLDGLGALQHAVPIGPPASTPRAVWQLRALLRGYQLVHAHGFSASWSAVLGRGRRRNPKLVTSVHNVVLDEAEGRAAPFLRVLERRLARRVDAVVAVSPEIADYLHAPNVTTVPAFGPPPHRRRTAQDVRESLGVGPGAPLVVCVARLHPQKGLDILLTAVPAVRAEVGDLRVVIVGEGPLDRELAETARRLGVADVVAFVPPTNPADEMAAADLVVIPSRWESGPLVLLEACALARPVVATDVGMVADIIDSDTGWRVPAGDATALANALVDALTRPDERERRAGAAALRAAPFLDPGPRIDLVENVYRASLDRS